MKINYYLKSVLTLVLFAASFFAFQAKAAEVINGVAYDVLDDVAKTAQVVALPSGDKYTGTLTIEATVTMNGATYAVTKIGDGSLRDAPNLTEVIIPEGVETIGNSSFASCTGITSIQLPASVNSIEDWAFYGCSSLTSIVIPEGVTAINGMVFNSCSSLQRVTIPSSVATIGSWAFQGTDLKEVYISWASQSDVNIDYWAFGNDDQRPNYVWKVPYSIGSAYSNNWWYRDVVKYTVVDGVAYAVLDETAKTAQVINLPGGDKYTGTLTIAANVPFGSENFAVTKIGNNSLRDAPNLTSVVIPEGVQDIGNSSFANCSGITSIQLPSSVNTIEDWAFYGCSSLTSIVIPEGVTAINSMVFTDCSSLESITIPKSVTTIEAWALQRTGLKEIYVSWENTGDVNINYWAFGDADNRFSFVWKVPYTLADVYGTTWWNCPVVLYGGLPSDVTVVDGVAYKVLDATAGTAQVIALPDGTKYTGTLTIAANVTINGATYAVTKIGDGALRDAPDLTGVTIPEGVETIGNSAFASCTGITSIQLPSTVSSIEDWAFYECSNLASINIPDGVTAINAHTFQNTGLTSINLPASVTSLKVCAFQDASNLASINLENITELAGYSLSGTALTTVVLPDGLTTISGGAFANCHSLESLTIPNSVTTIEAWALQNTGLKEIYVSWGTTAINIDYWAFGDAANRFSFVWRVPYALAGVYPPIWWDCPVIPYGGPASTVVVVDGVAYEVLDADAKTAQVIALPSGDKYTGTITIAADVTINGETYAVTKIGNDAFRDAPDLTGVIIPEGVETIGNSAFASCTGITSIQLPSTVSSIEDWAFYECSNLASINIPDGVTAINAHAFQNTGLTSINLPASVTSLKACAFQDASKLASINLENITEIGGWALAGTAITSANLENATTIAGWSFQDCKNLTSVTLADGLTVIDGGTFSGCIALDSLTIPSTVTTIKDWALEKTGLKEIYVSWKTLDGLTIENNAFGSGTGKANFVWMVPANLATVYGTTWLGYPVKVIGGQQGLKFISDGAIKLVNEKGAIRVVSDSNLTGTVDVYSVNGVKLYTHNGQINITIELPAGVYVVKIASSKGVITSKTIVK